MATEVIERYLRTRRLRYFRGHHDGEYFFIVTVHRHRLHVHLEMSGGDADVFTVRISPACFFPAAHRQRLLTFTDNWNRQGHPAAAIVHESSDPTRIGVVAEASRPVAASTAYDELASLADETIQSAVELFEELTPAAEPAPSSALRSLVPDAG